MAYQHNRFIAERSFKSVDTVSVSANVSQEDVHKTSNGFVIGIEGETRFADENTPTGTKTRGPIGHISFVAWYFVTPRFALREGQQHQGFLTNLDSTSLNDAEVVACAE